MIGKRVIVRAVIATAQIVILGMLLVISRGSGNAGATGSISISGTVTNHSNSGIPNVSVYATDPGGSTVDYGPVTTASDGSYQLDVQAGNYDFHFDPAAGSGLSPIVENNVTVSNDQSISVVLAPATHTLTGTLTDAAGNPLTDVSAQLSDSNGIHAQTTTDAFGNFSLTAASGTYTMNISANTFQGTIQNQVPPAFSINEPVNLSADVSQSIQLPPTTSLTILTQDSSSNPVGGVQVSGQSFGQLPIHPGSNTMAQFAANYFSPTFPGNGPKLSTDQNGSVVLTVFQNTGGNACAYFLPNTPTCKNSLSIGNTSSTVTFVSPLKHTFSGTLTDADGTPLANVQVQLSNASATYTGNDGSFSLTVPVGTYDMQILGLSYDGPAHVPAYFTVSESVDLSGSDVSQTIQLPPTTIANITTQDANNSPVSVGLSSSTQGRFSVGNSQTAQVTTVIFPPNSPASGPKLNTDANGTATETVFQNTNDSVCAYFIRDNPTCSSIAIGSASTAITLTAPAAATSHTLTGTLTDSGGNPVANVSAFLNGRSSGFATTDSNGNFSITVPNGSYSLTISASSYNGSAQLPSVFSVNNIPIDLSNGDVVQNIQLPPTTILTVIAQDAFGNPLEGLPVSGSSLGQHALYPGNGITAQFSSSVPPPSSPIGTKQSTGSGGAAALVVFQNSTAGACAYFSPNTPTCNTSPISVGTGGSSIIFRKAPPGPAIPSDLSAATPSQNPALNWTASSGATSYNVYRNGVKVDSSNSNSYTDSNAPEGTDTYYVTAVNTDGESGHSTSVSVLVDRTAPSIIYTVNPSANGAGWNNSSTTVTFTCSDMTSGIASCSPPVTESSDGTYTLTGTAVDNAGNSSSVNATINIDTSMPMAGTPSWTDNPVITGNTTTLTVPAIAAANHSPITGGEYYIGNSDPGQGNGTAMNYDSNSGNLTATLGSNLSPGNYQVHARSQNAAGAWSSIVTDTLAVKPVPVAPTITSANNYSIGVRQIITPGGFTFTTTGTPAPSLSKSGILPSGLTFTDNGDGTANFTGMVAAGTAGTYHINITAANSAGSVSQSFTLTITNTDSAPTTIFTGTGSNTLNVSVGTNASFTFTATGNGKNAKIFVFSGSLPPGLSLHDNKDGTASFFGTPTHAGTYMFTLEAQNKNGITYQQFTVVVQ